MTFTTTPLTGDRVLVKGRDIAGTEGTTVLDAGQWNELNQRDNLNQAQAIFDAAVETMFAPLIEAAEKAGKVLEGTTDPMAYVVLDEGSEGQAATPRQVVPLTRDSIVLRIIESGDTDRLVWVGDELEVVAYQGSDTDPVDVVPVEAPVEV